MRLHSIKMQNFMSMRDCCMKNLDPHMNFIVGPNGSGKSAILRILETIREAFRTQGTDSLDMEVLCTRDVSPQELDVTISVEFDMPWEQDLITAFLCAAFDYPDFLKQASELNQRMTLSDEIIAAFSAWLIDALNPETVSFLFHGDLRLTYRSGVHDYLRLSYTFTCSNEPITITAGMPAFVDGGLWKGLPPQTHLYAPPAESLLAAFFGRSDLLDKLTSYLTSQITIGPGTIDAAGLFLYLAESRGCLIARKVPSRFAHVPAYKRLSDLSGEPMFQSYNPMPGKPVEVFTFSHLIYCLLHRSFIFSTDVSMSIPTTIGLSEQDATRDNTLMNAEQQLALRLFHLKNGNLAQREQYKHIQKSFEIMTGQKFDIEAKTKIQTLGDQDTHHFALIIDPKITDSYGDISLRYHGAGFKEALVLAALLDEGEGCLVLLDEPTANLHPGMQHKLLEVLRTAPGQVIVVTHSAHVVPTHADEFRSVYRTYKNHSGTQIMTMTNSTYLTPDKIEQELSSSSDVAGLLFASAVILVEGDTEIAALSEWFPKSVAAQGTSFADRNWILYPVGGKTYFPFYLHFLEAFGVPWAVICDGDALPPNKDRNSQLWNALQQLGYVQAVPNTTLFNDLKTQGERAGIFTANTASDEGFEAIPDVMRFVQYANNHMPTKSKVRRGRYIAQHIPCPQEIETIFQHILLRLAS